ncbi:MAG TPA: sulfotransferase [Candidatus Saccharimonadales bacterium]|nr:sulfotransferase [Candidatus Saccharimonadales bacterium]
MKATKVMFVGGYGRSGSTIIDVLLNRVPGVVAVGEFRHLFGRALGDNELCSCTKPFRECDFWSKVLAEAFPDGVDRTQTQRAMKRFNRLVMVPFLRFPSLMTPGMRAEARIYRQAFAAAYAAVAKVSGAKVVVDSTKYPMHGWFIGTMPEIELKTMLLVRDPRAVAFSWERRRLRPEVWWEPREMPRHLAFMSAAAWDIFNALTAHMRFFSKSYRVERYEDFVADPAGELTDIASFALGTTIKLPAKLFEKQPHVPHTIAGNPVRIGSQQVKVKDDDEWRAMPTYKKLTVNAICLPAMIHYGYPLRSRQPPAHLPEPAHQPVA